jgi:ribonucleotide monophosphatase NagD (HAD superfamily)
MSADVSAPTFPASLPVAASSAPSAQQSPDSVQEPPEIAFTPAATEAVEGGHGPSKQGEPAGTSASDHCSDWSPDSVRDGLLSPVPSRSGVPIAMRAGQVQRDGALSPFGLRPQLVQPPKIDKDIVGGFMGDVGEPSGSRSEPSGSRSEPSGSRSGGRRRRVSADDEVLQGAIESLGPMHDADLGALIWSDAPEVRGETSEITSEISSSKRSSNSLPNLAALEAAHVSAAAGKIPPTSSTLLVRSSSSLQDLAGLEAAFAARHASLLAGAAAAAEAGPPTPTDVLTTTRRYDPALSRITGFLIDLDGTVYRPNSLIAGACTFHEWLVSTGKQFVYLSNTGAKSSEAVRRKLRTPRYYLAAEKLPPHCVWTAAEAQVEFMADHIPVGAKVFVVSGASGDFWLAMLRERCPALVDTWEIRTALSETEAKHWATIAAAHPKTPLVWVVMFIDGPLGSCNDPTTGEPSPADWSYDFIRNLSYLLGHGAHLAYTADDSSNPAVDDSYGGYVWPQPGPGMFAAMLKAIIPPRGMGRVHCLGKGGQDGKQYMMEHAIKLLREQGHSGDRKTICMVGDRFDTDIRGGCMVGITTCLVETGAHAFTVQGDYPQDVPTFVARSIGAMHGLHHTTPRCELPMVLRQPLRLWVLSNANVTTAHAVDKGMSLQLDQCLTEFYARESCAAGGFGRDSLLKAFDEIGLEVSEQQVDRGLETMLRGSKVLRDEAVGPIPYSLFALLIRKALRSVGVETPALNERGPQPSPPKLPGASPPTFPRLPRMLRPIPRFAERPPRPLSPLLSSSAGRRTSRHPSGMPMPSSSAAASSTVAETARPALPPASSAAQTPTTAPGFSVLLSAGASFDGDGDGDGNGDGSADGNHGNHGNQGDGSFHSDDIAGGAAANAVIGSAADVEERSPASSIRGLLLCRRSSSGQMSTVDRGMSIELSARRVLASKGISPDVEGSLRAVLRRRKSLGVGASASFFSSLSDQRSFSPWGGGRRREHWFQAEPTENSDQPPCESEPTDDKDEQEEAILVSGEAK